MSSEELAPSSLRNSKIERQNKYFKEQVLMTEETKIIAKNHKGESILTVDNGPDIDHHDEPHFNSQVLPSTDNKEKTAKARDDSDKASWDNPSDNEERNNVENKEPIIWSKTNSTTTINLFPPTRNNSFRSVPKFQKEIKFKNLSSDLQEFYRSLDEFNPENVKSKLKEKLNHHLKQTTINEILALKDNI